MRPLPSEYSTATPDGVVTIVSYRGEKIGEVKAKSQDQADILAAEEAAVQLAEKHAKGAAKPKRAAPKRKRPAAKKKRK